MHGFRSNAVPSVCPRSSRVRQYIPDAHSRQRPRESLAAAVLVPVSAERAGRTAGSRRGDDRVDRSGLPRGRLRLARPAQSATAGGRCRAVDEPSAAAGRAGLEGGRRSPGRACGLRGGGEGRSQGGGAAGGRARTERGGAAGGGSHVRVRKRDGGHAERRRAISTRSLEAPSPIPSWGGAAIA